MRCFLFMKRVINVCLCILYILFLITILFLYGRGGVWTNLSLKKYILSTSNIIPCKTIAGYFLAIKNGTMNADIPIKNIIGNIILFMPYAYFAFCYTRMSTKKFLLTTLLILIVLEIVQMLLRVGTFDVDDILLNIMGAMMVYVCIQKVTKTKESKKKIGLAS